MNYESNIEDTFKHLLLEKGVTTSIYVGFDDAFIEYPCISITVTDTDNNDIIIGNLNCNAIIQVKSDVNNTTLDTHSNIVREVKTILFDSALISNLNDVAYNEELEIYIHYGEITGSSRAVDGDIRISTKVVSLYEVIQRAYDMYSSSSSSSEE